MVEIKPKEFIEIDKKKKFNLLTDVKIPPRKWDLIKGRLR